MLKKVLIGLVAIIAIFMIFVAKQPSDYKIERSIVISAPAEIVFHYVNNVREANKWNPWLELDPKASVGYEGPPAGAGAISTWKGDSNVGAGKLEITESRPNEYIKTKLDFFEPMANTAEGEYILKTEGQETTVTWTMFGKNTFVGRMMCVFMNMDKMVGGQFEKGLANLKKMAEQAASLTK